MPKNPMKPLSKPKRNKTDKLTRFIDYLEKFDDAGFNGFIRVNFTQGNVGRIEKFEEVFNKDEDSN
ncbi:MAG: hypothetical protein R6V46_18375 [Desulfatiglandaceae bacterium]